MSLSAWVLISWQFVLAEEPPTGPQTEKRFTPLIVPPGFKATLFACDPLIEYPSCIATGPRPNSIFVAVDYMTGLGTEVVRRSEVRLIEDTNSDGYADKATLFAGGFNSIQGLTWHAGTLYVMHAPFLTALRDAKGDGASAERTDLLSGLGLTPEDNPVRLHCANGVAAGLDGWLYLALGDHGCDVMRPEGDRLVFQGGGILRCRPDGRDLHVFARGLRNIYDVALDEDLNVFVRDNENDGGTYKVRVCRSFYGADHGYPYLYDDHADEALPPLADLGLGSSAGGLAYLEPQYPAEYQGNLFFCEWGRAVMRYPLPKPGSSFGPLREIEFASGAQGDPYGFKPTDLVVQQDGALFVSDYADGQRPKRGRGRIYRITYVGDGAEPPAKPKPASPVSTEQWLAQLDAESYAKRVEAQEAIQAQGADGLKSVSTALNQQQLGVRGRLHAIWILARANVPAAIDDLLKLAGSDENVRIRAQAIRAIADLSDPILKLHRLEAGAGDPVLAARLAALGQSQTEPVLLEIIVALGRLRWTGAAEWLKDNLTTQDPALVHAAMQTLRRSENWPAILKLLDAPSSNPLRAIALRALAERYEPQVVDGLIERLPSESDPIRRREYAIALTRVHRQPGPWVYWGYKPPPRPPNTVDWERTEAIAAALGGVLVDSDRSIRLAVLRQMQREKIAAPLTALGRWLLEERGPEHVAAILVSLQDQPRELMRRHVTAVVRNSEHSSANRLAALALLDAPSDDVAAAAILTIAESLEDGPVLADAIRRTAKYPTLPSLWLLTSKLNSQQPLVRAAAIESLGDLGRAEGRSALLTLLNDPDPRVRRAAAGAAGKLAAGEAAGPLLKLAADVDSSVRRASFDSLRVLKEIRALPLALAALDDPQACLSALAYLGELGGPEHATAVAELAKRSLSAEVSVAAIRVLTGWRARPGSSAQVQQDLARAVAEVHGDSGTLIRWHTKALAEVEATNMSIEQLSSQSPSEDLPGWTTQFAAGTEARIILAKDAPKDTAWLAHSALYLSVPADVEFLASSSGSLEVWLNGKSVHQRDEPRVFRADSDRFPAALSKGDNRLVVLVRRSASPAEFHLHFRRKSAKLEHERLTRAALARAGNPERGRALFFNTEKSLCLKCHLVGDQGERTGPELTGIGGRFSRIHIVESLLDPSRTIAPSFGTLSVLLKDGQALSGIKVADTDTTLTLADNQGQKHVLSKDQIDDQKPSPQSTMPLGLETRYTEAEFIDLIAYLTNLKESPLP